MTYTLFPVQLVLLRFGCLTLIYRLLSAVLPHYLSFLFQIVTIPVFRLLRTSAVLCTLIFRLQVLLPQPYNELRYLFLSPQL